MPVKTFKPYTSSRRQMSVEDFSMLTTDTPSKRLTRSLRKNGGRNNTGQIMVRHRGGGHKRKYRVIDFKRDKIGIPGTVTTLEYDPNRSCHIALVFYADGEKRYIIHPQGLAIGAKITSGPDAEIAVGNALPIDSIPLGMMIHNIELMPGRGGEIARSAGAVVQLMAKEGALAVLKMPSGELRQVPVGCMATIGQVGNLEHENISLGNAGRRRHMGFRPHVRGTAMNQVDHPHGGGRGKSKGANHPRSPWNQPAKGYKTRSKKQTDWMIIRRRPSKKGA